MLRIKSDALASAATIKSWSESTKSKTAAKSSDPPKPNQQITNLNQPYKYISQLISLQYASLTQPYKYISQQISLQYASLTYVRWWERIG